MCLGIRLIPMRNVLKIRLSQFKLFNFQKQCEIDKTPTENDHPNQNVLGFSLFASIEADEITCVESQQLPTPLHNTWTTWFHRKLVYRFLFWCDDRRKKNHLGLTQFCSNFRELRNKIETFVFIKAFRQPKKQILHFDTNSLSWYFDSLTRICFSNSFNVHAFFSSQLLKSIQCTDHFHCLNKKSKKKIYKLPLDARVWTFHRIKKKRDRQRKCVYWILVRFARFIDGRNKYELSDHITHEICACERILKINYPVTYNGNYDKIT